MSKLAIFASGAGSNAKNIIQHFNNNRKAKISLIVTNNKEAGVLNIANENKIPSLIISRSDIKNPEMLVQYLRKQSIDLIVLAGFLWKIPEPLVNHFKNKIINIHPSLLPKFGGKGMYGKNVHEAVKQEKERETGITIHYVNSEYDKGAIITQFRCRVLPTDSAEIIEKKVRALEASHFPKEIEKLITT